MYPMLCHCLARARTVARCLLFVLVIVCSVVFLGLGGCSPAKEAATTGHADDALQGQSAEKPVMVRVASLKGPTSIGLVEMMNRATAGAFDNDFAFTIAGTADEILPGIVQGNIDIALLPANVAAVLYTKTQGALRVLNINTLGVLYVVTGDTSVQSFDDLAGRTIYLTGKGTTPQYVMEYLLESEELAGSVKLEYKSEATELAALLAADPSLVCVLPEPYATSVCTKNPALVRTVSLSEVWDAAQGSEGSRLVTGVTVVRNAFLEEHPAAVAEFVAAQEVSVGAVVDDPAGAAPLVVAAGIVGDEAIARAAIPNCNLVCITGQEMVDALGGYLRVLYDRDSAAVGGALPDDVFYEK